LAQHTTPIQADNCQETIRANDGLRPDEILQRKTYCENETRIENATEKNADSVRETIVDRQQKYRAFCATTILIPAATAEESFEKRNLIMTLYRRYILLFLVGSVVVALDQITKIWIAQNMRLYATEPILPGFLELHYIRNPGAAFGFLSGSPSPYRIPFFVGVSILAIGIILYLFHKMEESEFVVPVALSLVLGGAVGNLIDRIRLGEVIDFIYFHYQRFAWPAFNVADISITVGVFLLVLRMFFQDRKSFLEKEAIRNSEGVN